MKGTVRQAMHEGHGGHQHPPTGRAEATSVLEFDPDVSAGRALLTPAEVRNKVFTTARLREGYDLAQVDTFLDQVETTLTVVLGENARLKARLNHSRQNSPHTGDSASRIVAMAQDAADRALATAQEEAREIVTAARAEAAAAKREALSYGTRMKEGLEVQARQLRNLLAELQDQDGVCS